MIDEQLTNSSSSATTNPSGPVSEALVDINGPGVVALEVRKSGGDWVPVTDQSGSYSVSTPDSALEYRFTLDGEGPADVYFGP